MIGRLVAPRDRSRGAYAVAVLAVVALGLASRHDGLGLPALVGKYPGDAAWSLMVFVGWGVLSPRTSTAGVAALALATAFAIEALKLWQTPWWSAIRQSTVGHLVFGHVFSWQNLVAYAVGVAIGAAIECLLVRPRA